MRARERVAMVRRADALQFYYSRFLLIAASEGNVVSASPNASCSLESLNNDPGGFGPAVSFGPGRRHGVPGGYVVAVRGARLKLSSS
jgi:hypothetical protein